MRAPVRPTFYFIGVTTAASSSRALFPAWMGVLGRPEVCWEGIDMAIHSPAPEYRRVVEHIREEPLALGGLVTTHKIDLLAAARDLFDELGPYAIATDEVSSIAKDDGRLVGRATDPVAGGESLDAIIGPGYFGRSGGHVLLLGAGGSSVALTLHLLGTTGPSDRPERVVVVNRSRPRLERLRAMVERRDPPIEFEYLLNDDPARNDLIMERLPAGSVVINATGMGKDTPGSPLTGAAAFPERGVVWELNYRGDLDFLHQAKAQEAQRSLTVADGWDYFVRGWASVMSHVLHVSIDADTFGALSRVAAATRRGGSG